VEQAQRFHQPGRIAGSLALLLDPAYRLEMDGYSDHLFSQKFATTLMVPDQELTGKTRAGGLFRWRTRLQASASSATW
jgi:hypothetical protein